MSVYRDFYSDLVYAQTFGSENNIWLPDEEAAAVPATGKEVFIDLSKFRDTPLVETFFMDEDWITDDEITGGETGFALQVLVGGVWKPAAAASILVAGGWKSITAASVLSGGAWKA